jgi:endoglucanase
MMRGVMSGGRRRRRAALLLAAALLAGSSLVASGGSWPARSVRFSLQVEAGTGPLTRGVPLWGRGWMAPDDPSGEEARAGHRWSGGAPVHVYGWTPAGFQLVPSTDGWATLLLEAPPAESAFGRTFGGAVAVADVEAAGTELVNGRLRATAEGRMDGWTRQGPAGDDGEPVAFEGDRRVPARIRPGAGLAQRVRLTAGHPLTIRFQARAVPPPAYRAMPLRRRATDTPAAVALQSFQHGVNLGNYLEAPPGEDWGGGYTPSDFDAMRAEGFDHVRIPVAWHHHREPAPGGPVATAFFERVDRLVNLALERDLAVLLNWHHYEAFMQDPAGHEDHLAQGWRQIAARYADFPGTIAFEILNEPHGRADTFTMNGVYERLLPVIRSVAPERTVFVGPGRYQHIEELRWLRLPPDDNLAVSVHHYEPFLFTHQGAAWARPLTQTTGIVFPGPPAAPLTPDAGAVQAQGWIAHWVNAYNELPAALNPSSEESLVGLLRWARDWSDRYGYPLHVGEWGCVAWVDAPSRLRYHREMRRLLAQWELPWTLWDWNQNFRYWDDERQAPVEGLREALFN